MIYPQVDPSQFQIRFVKIGKKGEHGTRTIAVPRFEIRPGEDFARVVTWTETSEDGPIKHFIGKCSLEDVERLQQHSWSNTPQGYLQARINGQRRLMHQVVMDGKMIDHINRDKTDNRRENLRFTNKSQNSHNRDLFPNNTTGWKGVSKGKRKADGTQMWFSYITVEGKRKRLYYGPDQQAAIDARKAAEEELFV